MQRSSAVPEGRYAGRRRAFRARFGWAFRRFAPFFVAAFFVVFLPRQWLRTDTIRDSTAYHEAAQRVARGVSMYEPHPAPGPHEFTDWYYLYPPLLASALAPTAGMASLTFLRLWLLVLAGAAVVYAAALARLADGRVTWRGLVVWGAAAGMTGGTAAIGHGNVDMIVFALVGWGIAWAGARGAAFATAALVKVSPVWPLLVAVRRGGRRVVIGAGVAGVLALLVTVLALGPAGVLSETRAWFRWALPSVSQGQFW